MNLRFEASAKRNRIQLSILGSRDFRTRQGHHQIGTLSTMPTTSPTTTSLIIRPPHSARLGCEPCIAAAIIGMAGNASTSAATPRSNPVMPSRRKTGMTVHQSDHARNADGCRNDIDVQWLQRQDRRAKAHVLVYLALNEALRAAR
jgi:hypothetical protein